MNRVHDDQETTETESSSEEYLVHNVGRYSNDPVCFQMLINGKQLSMDVDTGEEVSIILEKTREEIFPEEKLRPPNFKLKTYTNEPIKLTGTVGARNRDQKFKTVVCGSLGAGTKCPMIRKWTIKSCPVDRIGQYLNSACSHHSHFTSTSLQLTSVFSSAHLSTVEQ